MKINNKEERQQFLEENIQGMGSYALVTYDNHTETIWITKYSNWCDDGSDWFLEAPNYVRKYDFDLNNQTELEYVKENGYIIKDKDVYEIDSPQTSPFLPDPLDDLTLISEQDCLEWILNNRENNY